MQIMAKGKVQVTIPWKRFCFQSCINVFLAVKLCKECVENFVNVGGCEQADNSNFDNLAALGSADCLTCVELGESLVEACECKI